MAISTTSSLAFPYVIGGIVDLLSNPTNLKELHHLYIGLVGLFGIGSIAYFFRYVCSNIAGDRILQRLRRQLFSQVIHQPIHFFDSSQTGELINRLSTDTSMMSKGLIDSFARAISQIVSGIGALAILCYLSPKLAAFIFFVVPPGAIVQFFWEGRSNNTA
uniref:ABC transmembrane type-1 domain-containing protein n=1 Tax=Arcella intermedia TaxID=1963864 RepID=A0A6B2LNL2_9EUKA